MSPKRPAAGVESRERDSFLDWEVEGDGQKIYAARVYSDCPAWDSGGTVSRVKKKKKGAGLQKGPGSP